MTKRNSDNAATIRAQNREVVSIGLDAVRCKSKGDKSFRFSSLLHHIDVDLLRKCFKALERKSAAGIDGTTWEDYEINLEKNLLELNSQIHTGKYRAQPALRCFIPKADGNLRPLGIQTIQDKIVQRAVTALLEAVYDPHFCGFSYGFRRGRGQHDALDALAVGVSSKKIDWVYDADIEKFFDTVNHAWLEKFIIHRIADKRIQRLIKSWLKIGYIEDKKRTVSQCGMPQGAVISPILSNVYLHYVLDLWFEKQRKGFKGDAIIVRYADDFVLGFQYENEGKKLCADLSSRLESFGIRIHRQKSRFIRFGRFAKRQCQALGIKGPPTFSFLGFVHCCGKSLKGNFVVRRRTDKKRMTRQLQAIKQELRKRMHMRTHEVGKWLNRVLTGYMNYYCVPDNVKCVDFFFKRVTILWCKSLKRRSQRTTLTWKKAYALRRIYFPKLKVTHPWPGERFDAKHSK